MDFTCIFFGILFIAAGLLFAMGKLHIHLSAWKQMPDEEKNRMRIAPLCVNIGEVIMLNGLVFLFKGLFAGFSSNCFTVAMVAWMIVAGFDVWYISKSKKYIME